MNDIFEGNVEITKENAKEWEEKLKGIKKITGYVWAGSGATVTLPACVGVGGDVWAGSGATVTLPACVEVGGDVRAGSGATVTLPACVEVGGYVWAGSGATVTLPTKIGKTPKPIFERFKSRGYLLADGILCRIISQRKSGKIIIYKTNRIGNRRKIVYVVQKGMMFSHGETVKKASHDLRYKLSDRDTTKYKGWTLDSVHTSEQLIQAYRVITGACETGTRQYCEGKKLPAKMSVKVAIRLTRGAWGNDKFAAFFKEGK